ncbi:MAG: hypothetical protein M1531_07925 [Chloroflexi bacterium]|nr:hypothetical protein [Chloroflexota bacterium]
MSGIQEYGQDKAGASTDDIAQFDQVAEDRGEIEAGIAQKAAQTLKLVIEDMLGAIDAMLV